MSKRVLSFLPKVQFFNEMAEYKTFTTTDHKTKKEKKGIVCLMPCRCEYLGMKDYEQEFVSKGVSFCSDGDEFDINKGISIARTKAEINARRSVINEISKDLKVFRETYQLMDDFKSNLEEYNKHDYEYISKF